MGQFGSGNSGNDGSLESMLNFLKRVKPDCELLCICSDPKVVEQQYRVRAVSISGVVLRRGWFKGFNRFLLNLPRRVLVFCSLISQLNDVDVLIIPGTGILDDFQEHPFGWPFVVFRWCIATRLRKARVAFVSIGAGPVSRRVSRWFMRAAANTAGYRSFRDEFSREYVKNMGVNVSRDGKVPDIAFSLPAPQPASRPRGLRLVVGVGLMHYRGWAKDLADADDLYERYISKMAGFVEWLTDEGHDVRLLTGDRADLRAVADLSAHLAATRPLLATGRITSGEGGTLHGIMRDIALTDIVIVSRYHNAVCALKLGRPIISLGYAQKNVDLLADFEQHKYALHIETFDVQLLAVHFREICVNLVSISETILSRGEDVNLRLAEQERAFLEWIDAVPIHRRKPSKPEVLSPIR
ncbi:hypothetical protein ASG68_28170 [Rhizobium sp. Leaf453]|nr:hypothetical protein ASG50_16010 [Rhizobium sp. Leaf386]KQT05131.1 hypothetical protein ASG42_21665 [Rhizobium sp. Leaf391]KQU02117.1 hypothetical protein ASG68_28170 [Rhizobium sp. Leaf453]